MKENAGFTLLELIIIVAIISVLAAVAVPNLVAYLPNYRLNRAMEELQTNMQMARLKAVKDNARVVVQFDPVNESYQAFVDNGLGGGTRDDGIRNGTEPIFKTVAMPQGIDLIDTTLNNERLIFNSRGLPVGTFGTVQMGNGRRFRGVRVLITGNPVLVQSTDGGSTWNQM